MRRLFAAVGLLLFLGQAAMLRAAEPDTTSLADLVRTFNGRSAADTIGKHQPRLTPDEVIAAIRWSLLEKDKLPVSAGTWETLSRIADLGEVPTGFELEVITGFEPNDRVEFTGWSVRLRVPAEPQGTTCVMIREQWVSSRPIGEAERKVIHQWQKKEPPGSLARSEWTRVYARKRAKAAEIDRAEPN